MAVRTRQGAAGHVKAAHCAGPTERPREELGNSTDRNTSVEEAKRSFLGMLSSAEAAQQQQHNETLYDGARDNRAATTAGVLAIVAMVVALVYFWWCGGSRLGCARDSEGVE